MTASERETERVWRFMRNLDRRMRRRELYRTDPIWRLTKLKDNRERRLRAKRGAA
jgi:hypothetical protein